ILLDGHSNIEEATEILDELSSRDQDENELGFYYYYKGLISQDKTDYYKSIRYFKKSDDKYFIQLPLLQLERMGADLELLNLISI
ncbi:hypothetical protein ABET08_17565, partial [Bacillus subtilis]